MAKRALLIGINRYQIPGADLRGCVNDVKNIKAALTKFSGFSAAEITTLTDLDATKKNIEAGIKKLVASGKKGDVLYLHYSGHGANVLDQSGDEADRRDEILCPTDLDWYNPLLDDWLRTQFDKVRSGVNLTVVMDCCHSGSNTRQFLPPDAERVNRFLPNPLDLLAVESSRKLKGKLVGTLRTSSLAKRKKSDIVEADIPEVLITGCRDTQTSADAYIGNSYNGALTWHLTAAIKEKKGKLTYRDLHALTMAKLKEGDFDQVPQLEGQKARFDAQFLSSIA